jgi:hypothetical protein
LTPSMKLKAFTKPASHSAAARAITARTGTGRSSRPASIPATTALPAACWTSRPPAGSPRRSSSRPRMPKNATATANASASPDAPGTGFTSPRLASSPATSRPSAIGAPPPRGVGTECDDRCPGMSITMSLRNRAIVSGSATTTIAPHARTAHVILAPEVASRDGQRWCLGVVPDDSAESAPRLARPFCLAG